MSTSMLCAVAVVLTATAGIAISTAAADALPQAITYVPSSIAHPAASERDAVEAETREQLTAVTAMAAAAMIVAGLSLVGIFFARRSRNAVRAANISLHSANAALEKALRARTDFLAMTSHEIRTPLNGILGMMRLILTDSDLPDETAAQLRLIEDAGRTMKALVDDVLDMSKMESGKLTLEAAPFAVGRVLRDMAMFWKMQGHAKGLDVAIDIAPEIDSGIGDEQRLRQIVSNLVSNAVKFTQAGFVSLSAGAVPRTDKDGFWMTLSVADSGIGISEDSLERIFEAFQQADSSTTRRYGGTGLGLAICNHLVKAMGGSLTVTSRVGHGLRFDVRLPFGAAPHSMADRLDPEAPPVPRALIVDMNLVRQATREDEVTAAGFDVLLAETPDAAIAMASKGPLARVYIDGATGRVNELDGLIFLRTLRRLQPLADIEIVGGTMASSMILQVPDGGPDMLDDMSPPTTPDHSDIGALQKKAS